ncbi:MAG TPA: menaquinol oxidoreductase, partial [Geobacteraceae bacterium]
MRTLVLITTLALAGLVLVATGMYILPLDSRDRSPVQPIAFSHRIHADSNGIHCLFCNRFASESPTAGIPTV